MEWYWWILVWIGSIHTLWSIYVLCTDDTVVPTRTKVPPTDLKTKLKLASIINRLEKQNERLKEMTKK